MPAIENKFTGILGERHITSYDYLDVAKGTAIQVWYGWKGDTNYELVENPTYSDDIETTNEHTTTSANAKRLDLDFDVEIGKPLVIEGTCIITVANGLKETHTVTASNAATYIVAKIYRDRGGSESLLGTATGQTISVNNPATQDDRMNGLGIDVARTSFTKGDIFRLTIEVWAVSTGNVGDKWTVGIGHDPQNRDSPSGVMDATQDTTLKIAVPIRIDL